MYFRRGHFFAYFSVDTEKYVVSASEARRPDDTCILLQLLAKVWRESNRWLRRNCFSIYY